MAQGSPIADEGAAMTLDREDIVRDMGEFGSQLFERLDPRHRTEDRVRLLNVRDARNEMTSARAPGHGKVLKPERGADNDGEIFVISRADLVAAFKASQAGFDWAEAFAPRSDLPASTATFALRRGRRARALPL